MEVCGCCCCPAKATTHARARFCMARHANLLLESPLRSEILSEQLNTDMGLSALAGRAVSPAAVSVLAMSKCSPKPAPEYGKALL